jgi:hypothetical protein
MVPRPEARPFPLGLPGRSIGLDSVTAVVDHGQCRPVRDGRFVRSMQYDTVRIALEGPYAPVHA